MSENSAINRIRDVLMPDYYFNYYDDISKKTFDIFEKAASAKSTLVDSSANVEPKIAFDLADRVAKMHEIDIADPLRELLKTNGKELSALILSKEIALGKYLSPEANLEEKLDLAVRVGLAIVTEGVTIARRPQSAHGLAHGSIRRRHRADESRFQTIRSIRPRRFAVVMLRMASSPRPSNQSARSTAQKCCG